MGIHVLKIPDIKRIMSKCQRSTFLTIVGVLWFPAVRWPEIRCLAGKQEFMKQVFKKKTKKQR